MNGVILGRFMPPHTGHLFLIDFARSMVDRLYVLVCTLESEPIPGDVRYRWVRELAPNCTVIHITEENPAAARGQTGATGIWADTVRKAVPEGITHVFASEDYGWDLAYLLEAQFVPVDTNRSNIPVSASMIRENPYRYWQYIPPPVRPWFLRHVAVVGLPEVAAHLAQALGTVVVHPYQEFWRTTWNSFAGHLDIKPLSPEMIQRGAASAAGALARQANRLLIHDVRTVAAVSALKPDLVVAELEVQNELADLLSGTAAGFDAPLIVSPAQVNPENLAGMLGIS